jgi:hypothetical protein
MAQTKDLFGAVDTYMSHQHDIEAILRGDSLGGAGAAPSSGAAAKGGKSGGGKGGGGSKGGGSKGGGGKGPSSPTTARRMAELETHAPTTALAGRLAGCVCSLLRLQLAQLVLRVEALVVAKDANGGGVKGESRKAAVAAKKMKAKPKGGSRSRRRSTEDEEDEEEDDEEGAEDAEDAEVVAGALGDDEAAVRELLMTSDGL